MHAVLSPSASGRWTICTPSARLELNFPEEESPFAAEGTLAHAIAEAILKDPKKVFTKRAEEALKRTHPASYKSFFSASMVEHAYDFANYVLEHAPENYLLFVEHRFDITNFIPEGFGTGDAGLIYDRTIELFDLKYGKGVSVFAEDNKQLKIYALGALNDFGFLDDFDTVVVHIFQPRIANISHWTISVKDLLKWGEEQLKPKALLAFNGEGDLVAGEHCTFCKAKARCRALADYNLQLAKEHFRDPFLLEDDELMAVFLKKSIFESWIKEVGEYVLREAIKGKVWPGHKLVEGKSNRIYTDEPAIIKVLKDNKISEFYKPQEILGITEMESKLTKPKFHKLLNKYVKKPSGKPTLVLTSDKRPVYNSAAIDFKDDYIDDDSLI